MINVHDYRELLGVLGCALVVLVLWRANYGKAPHVRR